MDIIDIITDLTVFPWNSLDIAGIFVYISGGLFYAVCTAFLIVSRSKKIRYLSFKCYFTYIVLFAGSILFLFIFLWYTALPIIIIVSALTYRSTKKELDKIREEEMGGGWCCNFKYRKQQVEDFKFKPDEEQEAHREYCIRHPVVLKPKIIVLFCIMIPIAITLILWLCGVGYRWYGYPLVEIIE
jgi:hypothetical protein